MRLGPGVFAAVNPKVRPPAAKPPTGSLPHCTFHSLSPERVLSIVEQALGIRCTNLCRPYASYINRVFELEDADGNGLVAKFYRPGRWSTQALQEEHAFLLELAADEIGVIPPLPLRQGGTLGLDGTMHFAVFPRLGGRCVDEFNDEQWLTIGRLLGRMHLIGARRPAPHRPRMHPAHTAAEQVAYLLTSGLLPDDLAASYDQAAQRVLAAITPLFASQEAIRIHGDCHAGNLIYRPGESFMLIDFDDMVMGPPVQDLWMLLPGPLDEAGNELELMIEGYETFRSFHRGSLRLIEPLRAMRFIHYAAWCARQVLEDGATLVVPHFGSRSYWQTEIDDLTDQWERITRQQSQDGNDYDPQDW